MLVDGVWSEQWSPKDGEDGATFKRKPSSVRNWVTLGGEAGPTGSGGFRAEADRYHLYVGLICPWACRTLMARKLKRLDALVDVSVVEPRMTDQGWRFGGGADDLPRSTADALHGATYMHQVYTRSDPRFTGRATVPVLWDKARDTIVNNESADILRMFDGAFAGLAPDTPSLYPADLATAIDALNDDLYGRLNNGVYRAGFATEQDAYEGACRDVFAALDGLEERLAWGGPFLFGDRLTESDLRLFVTLIRFDAAYHGNFKCNLRRIADLPALQGFVKRMLAIDGVAETVSLAHIKAGYYNIRAVNPTGIVPLGPALDLPDI